MTTVQLPPKLIAAMEPVFSALPLARAMPMLVGVVPQSGVAEAVERTSRDDAVADSPPLQAGLWLYVDDLDRSHAVSQGIEDATGAFWHGIMHRREGDFANSHYWMRRASTHPLFAELDPAGLIDAVAAASGRDEPELVERQRLEWAALFEWCAHNP